MKNARLPMVIAAILITLGNSGCSSVRYKPVTLPVPARPVLPPITAADLECLNDETYRALATRQRLMREYTEELEAILRPP
ncbi:MAG: hypothetical protein COW58_14410 [Thalassolituus sp. CG17_big_fil_post_rev_8_21_14_2_50_53_8]|nr:MAG: hypothetical protein COW58_14410 [Thalassolituus sp. CG17_big_fil_post_rev_8_21_14_2_50_53_8]